jgi:hypothetical protein
MSRLADQIEQVLPAFSTLETPPALIGGLALAAHKVIRATRDVDFLVASEDAERVHALLLSLDYQCVHRSEDAANYVRRDEGFDLLYAHRPIANALLREALLRETPLGKLRVISAEGLIGFKLQAVCNDPSRSQDIEDIRQLLRANRAVLEMSQVRRYFELFERETLLDELLAEKE